MEDATFTFPCTAKRDLVAVVGMHLAALIGAYLSPITWHGLGYMLFMAIITGIGITAGYHRLWCHRAYHAVWPYRAFMAFWGAGALEESILLWTILHRLHHSFPDTPADPYGPAKGFWYAHCLWIFDDTYDRSWMKKINVQDIKEDKVAMIQHKIYPFLSLFVAFGVPLLIFSDKTQALVYGGFWARVFTWQSTWCVNSVAHWFGDNEYSTEVSAKDHFVTALFTLGEGNHGFHHAFPYSYQNGLRWYQIDPSRTLIEVCSWLGITYDLRHPEENEIQKARYEVMEAKLTSLKQSIVWPDPDAVTAVISPQEYRDAKKQGKTWIAYKGRVYDVASFAKKHPGGESLLRGMASAPPEYIEEQYAARHMHSRAARNVMDTLLIGKLAA